MESAESDDIFLTLSSDHIMRDEDVFAQLVEEALPAATESIITFGIKPTRPHTGYGYIRFEQGNTPPYQVLQFKEKPDEATAKQYVQDGYYWNSGIFLFSKQVFLDELQKGNPEYYHLIQDGIIAHSRSTMDSSRRPRISRSFHLISTGMTSEDLRPSMNTSVNKIPHPMPSKSSLQEIE